MKARRLKRRKNILARRKKRVRRLERYIEDGLERELGEAETARFMPTYRRLAADFFIDYLDLSSIEV